MVDPIALRRTMYLESKSNNISSGFKILYCGQNNAINHPWLGMVSVRTIKMVMTGGWFMALFYPHYCPELQRTPKTHRVTTPRFNLAFVKLVNFEIITAVYNNKSPICEWFIPPTPPTYGDLGDSLWHCFTHIAVSYSPLKKYGETTNPCDLRRSCTPLALAPACDAAASGDGGAHGDGRGSSSWEVTWTKHRWWKSWKKYEQINENPWKSWDDWLGLINGWLIRMIDKSTRYPRNMVMGFNKKKRGFSGGKWMEPATDGDVADLTREYDPINMGI